MPTIQRLALPAAERGELAAHVKSHGLRATARETRVAARTIARAMQGERVPVTAAALLARITPKVRTAEEFKRARAVDLSAPTRTQGPYTWPLSAIRQARDEQLRGVFALPVRLAEALRTDDALYTAYLGRVAPQSALQTRLVPHASTRGAGVAARAAEGVIVPRAVIAGIVGTLANHGLAIGRVVWEPNEEGTHIAARLTEWPLEHVRWDAAREVLTTRVKDGPDVDIIHGDGTWIVFRKFADRPWTQEACVLPAAFVWAAHSDAISDWASSTRAHGLAKVVGELPEGTSLAMQDGTLTAEAEAFLSLLRDLVSGEAGAGIRPAGAKTDFLANGSTAWQVFHELTGNREKAAARIYLGTDASLGSVGGAPGVDIATLFGVATTKVQGDCGAIALGLSTGLYAPWTAINWGDSRYAPTLEYLLPDPDEDAKREEGERNRTRLFDALDRMRALGFVVDQAVVNALAARLGVEPAPQLAATSESTAAVTLAPTDVAWTVTVNEYRQQSGQAPLALTDGTPDPDGALAVAAYRAKKEAALAAPPPAPAPAGAPA